MRAPQSGSQYMSSQKSALRLLDQESDVSEFDDPDHSGRGRCGRGDNAQVAAQGPDRFRGASGVRFSPPSSTAPQRRNVMITFIDTYRE